MSRFTSPSNARSYEKSLRKSLDGSFGNAPKRNSVAKSLRKSTGSSLSLQKQPESNEMAHIEAEYIKNLQQQIYFLELEANYLREQSKKAAEIQPQMTAETERLIHRLKNMETELAGANVELRRKESSVTVIHNEKMKLLDRLRTEEESRRKDKNMYADEIIQLKKDKVILDRDLGRKDDQITDLNNQNEKQLVAVRNSEMLVSNLKSQLEQRIEQHKLTQIAVEERRNDLVTAQAQLRAVEEKYYNSAADISSSITQDLRDDVRLAHQKIKELELSAESDKSLKDKMATNLERVVKENASLSQQLLELSSHLGHEEKMRDMNLERRNKSHTEFVTLQDKCKQLTFDLGHTEEMLTKEKARNLELVKQLRDMTSNDIKLTTSHSRIAEVENLCENLKADNDQLIKDKLILVDHVADIQNKVTSRDNEIAQLQRDLASANNQLKTAQGHNDLEKSMQSQKWEEFGRLAESMQQLSASMRSTSTSQLLRLQP